MPNTVSVRRLVLIAAFAGLVLPGPARAVDQFDLSVPEEGAEAEAPDLECATESLSGSGPGFASSRKESEEAAIKSWTEKAQAVYPEADFELAKESNLSCAVQGLYSKCFADGIPCKPKDDGDTAKSE